MTSWLESFRSSRSNSNESSGEPPCVGNSDSRTTAPATCSSIVRSSVSLAEIPEALRVYVDKVALHAYKVTDRDIEELKQAGYSEDAIFEITLSAALGAGMSRLERGLAALRGENPCG